MDQMKMVIPLRKVDAEQRLVWGLIDETPDRDGEVFDYDSSKPHFSAWSDEVAKATDGKSQGNVRAMHGNVAAGKLQNISFNDEAKSIELCAKIVDDGEWEKVRQGVYTGFSPGGRYVKRWQDGDLTRYTAQPSEVSIVDMPCIPSAHFTMVKDGGAKQVLFKSVQNRLSKAGARNSQADLEVIQAIHDHAVALGAQCQDCADDEAADDDDMDDAFTASDQGGGWHKVAAELAAVRRELGKAANDRQALLGRIAELERQPRQGGPALKSVVNKAKDQSRQVEDPQERIDALADRTSRGLELIKLSHQNPQIMRF